MDKQDIQAQAELGQKLAGVFGTMGRERPAYKPENMGGGGSAYITAEGTGSKSKRKIFVPTGPTKGHDL